MSEYYIENVESEALEAVARWSVIGKVEFLSASFYCSKRGAY